MSNTTCFVAIKLNCVFSSIVTISIHSEGIAAHITGVEHTYTISIH